MGKTIPFLDLRVDDDGARNQLLDAIDSVLRHGRLVMGPEVEQFERAIASWCGRKHAVGVNSGTEALYLGLRSLGIGPGDEVITTCLSWIASTNAIALTGARPVFADVGNDLNMDPDAVSALITERTRAILAVHYTGKICRMAELTALAERHQLLVVEDAAQAFGATYRGKCAGAFGAIGCFSMNPMKVFAACGDAGVVLTDRDDVYERLLALRYNGVVNKETCLEPSSNSRLDTIQAAILLKRLEWVPRVIEKRRHVARWYNEALSGVVETRPETPDEQEVFYTYTIQTPRRDELKRFLEARGIETKIQYPMLMCDHPAYVALSRSPVPNGERLVKRILCLPANERITHDEVCYVAATIREFFTTS